MSMVKLSLNSLRELKPLIEFLNDMFDEIYVTFDENGMCIKQMNRSHVFMVKVYLGAWFFSDYECLEKFQCTIDMVDLNNAFKRTKPTNRLKMELSEDELKMTVINDMISEVRVDLTEYYDGGYSEPDIEKEMSVVVQIKQFKEAVGKMNNIANKVCLSVEKNKLILEGERGYAQIRSHPAVGFLGKSRFNIDYLKPLGLLENFGRKMNLYIGEDKPLVAFIKSNREDGHVELIVAPRIKQEEDENEPELEETSNGEDGKEE